MTRKRKSARATMANRDAEVKRTFQLRKEKREFRAIIGAGLTTLALLAISAAMLLRGPEVRTQVASEPVQIGGSFTLVDGNGTSVTERDFLGRYLLVYFGYTSCPDVCPTTLNQVAAAMESLGSKAASLQPLFISVDPPRDTPEVVRKYAAAFGPRIIGLTGTLDQVAAVTSAYHVYYSVHRSAGADSNYTVDHSSILYLMGPDGRFIAPIRADLSASDMTAQISKHLS